MTEETNTPSGGINVAVAKGIALGLGVLLLGGTALLITLLVVRQPTPTSDISAGIELNSGEKITDVSTSENQMILLVEDASGRQKIVMIDLATGGRTEVPVLPL